jgi:hypothetical protein
VKAGGEGDARWKMLGPVQTLRRLLSENKKKKNSSCVICSSVIDTDIGNMWKGMLTVG